MVACPRCGDPFEGGGELCAACGVELVRAAEERDRRAVAEADRRALGLHPATRARNFTAIALDAALHWTGWATRFATAAELDRLARIRQHVRAAREALD